MPRKNAPQTSKKPVEAPELVLLQQDIIINTTDSQKRVDALRLIASEVDERQGWFGLLIDNKMPLLTAIMDIIKAEELNYPELEVASAIMNHLVLPDSQFTQKMVNEYDALTAVSEVLKKLASQPPATKDASYNSSVENCILVLGNIAVGSKSLKRAVLDSDATETILKILVGVFTVRISRAAVWALQSFLRGGHETPCLETLAPTLVVCAGSLDEEIRKDAVLALSHLADASDESKQLLVRNAKFYPTLRVVLASSDNRILVIPALRAFGNVLSLPEEPAISEMIEKGLIADFVPLMNHEIATIRREVCWSFSNILSDSAHHVELCQRQGVISKLIDIFMREKEQNVAKEAAWALANAFLIASPSVLCAIIQLPNFIQAYASLLRYPDDRLFAEACVSIEHVLAAIGHVYRSVRSESSFLEVLRVQCYDIIEAAFALGGPNAILVRPLHEAFHETGTSANSNNYDFSPSGVW